MPFMLVETNCERLSAPPKYEARKMKKNLKRTHQSNSCKVSFHPAELQHGDCRNVSAETIKVRWLSPKLPRSHLAFEYESEEERHEEAECSKSVTLVHQSTRCNQSVSLMPMRQETIKISKSIAESTTGKVSAGRMRSLLRRWSIQLGGSDPSVTAELRSDVDCSGLGQRSDLGRVESTAMTVGFNSGSSGTDLWHTTYGSADASVSTTGKKQSLTTTIREDEQSLVESRFKETQSIVQQNSNSFYPSDHENQTSHFDTPSETKDLNFTICNCIQMLTGESGFTHAKFSAMELLSDVLRIFLAQIAERMKQVKERELSGIGHGFPDPLERVLTDMGFRGTRGIELFGYMLRKPCTTRAT